jgi:hypothetical protein
MLLGLVVLAGGIAAGFYYSGLFTHDPGAQAKELQAKIENCTTMAQVLAVAEPRKTCIYVKKTSTMPDGTTFDTWHPGPEVKYDKAALEQRIDDGTLEGGFEFHFTFTDKDRIVVKFDQFGNVEYVHSDDRIRKLFD